jgi:hypothetical protein
MHSRRADCLGRRPVDLVPDHDVGEDAAGTELELAGVLVEHRHAGDVGGQQVRRELDPADRRVDAAGQGLGQHRLADTGHVLDQQVTLGEQHHQRRRHDVRLPLDDPLDVRPHQAHDPGQRLEIGASRARSSHVWSSPSSVHHPR